MLPCKRNFRNVAETRAAVNDINTVEFSHESVRMGFLFTVVGLQNISQSTTINQ